MITFNINDFREWLANQGDKFFPAKPLNWHKDQPIARYMNWLTESPLVTCGTGLIRLRNLGADIKLPFEAESFQTRSYHFCSGWNCKDALVLLDQILERKMVS